MPSVSRPRWLPNESTAFDAGEMARLERALAVAMEDRSCGREAVFRRNVAMAAWISLRTGARCGEALAMTRKNSIRRRGGRSVRIDSTVMEEPGRGAVILPSMKGKRGRNVAVTERDMAGMAAHAAWQEGSYLPNPSWSLPLSAFDIARLKAYVERNRIETSPDAWIDGDGLTVNMMCPFLDEERMCKVYEARPEICRVYRCDLHKAGMVGSPYCIGAMRDVDMREVFG